MRWTAAATLAWTAGLALGARPLAAQRHADIDRADSLLEAGRLPEAENLYYAAARERPRDPAVRRALGRYLAGRGALRIGAVLLEEARYFGANGREVAAELAPLYAALADYRALAALPASPLTPAEQRRAEWLAANPPGAELRDSAVTALAPAEREGIGDISLVIGSDTLVARIDPGTSGIVLDTTFARRRSSRLFGATGDPRRSSAIVHEVAIGPARLRRVPARFTVLAGAKARIGLDVLAPFAPTFDEHARVLVLHAPRTRQAPGGDRYLTFATRGTLLVSRRTETVALDSPVARAWLAGRRWTWLARSGEIRVAR